MRPASAILAALAAVTPASAQPCDCGFGAATVAGVSRPVPATRPIPRTRGVPRARLVPPAVGGASIEIEARPGAIPGSPGSRLVVLDLPPLFDHPCYTGSIGCNPNLSGPLYDY